MRAGRGLDMPAAEIRRRRRPAEYDDDLESAETLAGLRQPERSEMLDFSDVYPAITREFLAQRAREAAPRPQPERAPNRRPERIDHPRRPQYHRNSHYRVAHDRPAPRPNLPSIRHFLRLRNPGWLQDIASSLEFQADAPNSPLAALRLRLRLWPGYLGKLLPVWMLINLVLLGIVLAALASQAVPKAIARATTSCQWYTVAPNQTLYGISASFHLPASVVAQANHLKSYGAVYAGMRLCIPSGLARLIPEAQDALEAPNLIATRPAVSGVAKFLQFALPYAESAHQQTGWPVSMILAQWGLEHGWAVPGFTGYNWGNVGALPGAPRVASGGAIGAPAFFAYAATPQDGVNYYVAVAGLSFYSGVARAGRRGGPDAAAKALGASPWDAGNYTAIGDPGSSLIILMHDFNLYRFDG
jgi:LysM repeat protein